MDQKLPANLVKTTYRHAWPYHANEENLHHPRSLFGWLMKMKNKKNSLLVKILTFFKWMWKWPSGLLLHTDIVPYWQYSPPPPQNPSPASTGTLKHHLLGSVQHRLKSIFSSNLSLIFKINTPSLSHFDTIFCHPNKKNKEFQALSVEKNILFKGSSSTLEI